jgi:predicted transposase YdaD
LIAESLAQIDFICATTPFGVVKLLDWRDRIDELESSSNPFAIVVLAHLKVIETKGNVEQRKAWKFRLAKMLYERGYERQEILDLYRFVDWAMILPEALEREFWRDLQTYEEERKVTYVTNAERFGFERGIQEGEQRGRQAGIQEGELTFALRLITRRIGPITLNLENQIRSLSLTQLEDLGEALLGFSEPNDLENWLEQNRSN